MIDVSMKLAAARATAVCKAMSRDDSQYEPEVASLVVHLFRASERGLFVDVGSNIGFFPLLLAKCNERRVNPVEIVGHEPLPDLQRIAAQVQIANAVSYRLEPTAVADFSGTADFFISAVSDSSNSLVAGFRKSKGVITVAVDTLDRLYADKLDTAGYDEIVVMIDVETAEPAVLRGAETILAKHRPLVICEVLAGRTERDIAEVFARHNYSCFRFDGSRWVREQAVVGDRTYKHRDWFFAPAERLDFGDGFAVSTELRIKTSFR